MRVLCYRCGTAFEGDRVPLREVCSRCGAFLHCCRNCDFYAPGVANDCREPGAPQLQDKEARTFREWFRPGTGSRPGTDVGVVDARAALRALFRKRDEDER